MLSLNHHLVPARAKANLAVTDEGPKQEVLFNVRQTNHWQHLWCSLKCSDLVLPQVT